MAGYARLENHRAMVFDRARNDAYAAAIRAAITSTTVVLDLGAGLGLLGLIAARAGARRVYLLEPEGILAAAAQIADRNQLSSRVIPVCEKLEGAALPEPVDLIISVLTGNCLLEEDLLPALFKARERHLVPGGTLIPDRATMEVVPVSARKFHDKEIVAWSRTVETIEFDAARVHAANSVYCRRALEMEAEHLATAAEILHLDFMTANEAACRGRVTFSIAKAGSCHGFLGWFSIRLGEVWLSTSPEAPETHWRQMFFPVDPPIQLKIGDLVSFVLIRPEYGDWTWTVETDGVSQRHSTFLSVPRSPESMKKKSDAYLPKINRKGTAWQFVISRMDGRATVAEIAHELAANFPDLYPQLEKARRFVDELTSKYG